MYKLRFKNDCFGRVVNFRENPLTEDVRLPEGKEEVEEEEKDREVGGREFMNNDSHEARKRGYAILNGHRANKY